MGICGIVVGLYWDIYGILSRLAQNWDFCGIFFGFLWDFCGIALEYLLDVFLGVDPKVGFFWDFFGILWGCYGIAFGILWDCIGVSMGYVPG